MTTDRRSWLRYEVARRLRRGDSQRQIARALEIDRKTVKALKEELKELRERDPEQPPVELAPKTPRPSKLDPYRDFIAQVVDDYPDIHATRLLEKLQAQGFDGKYTIVRTCLNEVRPKPKKRASQRVETPPGLQGQVDWSPYALEDGTPFHALSMVAGYSRWRWMRFRTDTRRVTLMRGLVEAFEELGGVFEELVFDSMPGVVDGWEGGQPILNATFVDFAAHYGFSIHVAPRGDGAYKGKVERPFRYLEENFFNGRTFYELEVAQAELAAWLERVNAKPHTTTKRPPVEMLATDRECLAPLPAHPYDTRELCFRVVDDYASVLFDTKHYSVPPDYVGHVTYVRASESVVEVFDRTATCIARHPRLARDGEPRSQLDEHRPRRRAVSWDVLLGRFESFGETCVQWARSVREHNRYGRAQLAKVLALQQNWSTDDVIAAIEHAQAHLAWDVRSIERILQVRATPRTFADQLADTTRQRIREAMDSSPIQQRGLHEYQQLLNPEDEDTDAEEEDPDPGIDP